MVPLSPASEKRRKKESLLIFTASHAIIYVLVYQPGSRFFGMPGIRSWSVFAGTGRLFIF